MSYNPATDFLGLWRNNAGAVSKAEIPGLDYVVKALARAGLFTLSVSATQPVANQSTTAWLQAAVPSYSAEGALFLWDKVTTTYLPATSTLLLQLLEASAGENGVSWWTSTGGPPLNTVGNNGDFAVRTDAPNGIYGPKALGAWPLTPIPGTADVITSASLDNTFGTTPGQLIYRGAAVWQTLAIGTVNAVFTPVSGVPAWEALLTLLDSVFGSTRGSVLYRGAGAWTQLPPGVATQVLSTSGPGADPVWSPRTPEFLSGTIMLFGQTAAPIGWTKQTVINDYGLRVTSGTVGTTAGTAFSTIFAQTAVGNTTISVAQIPAHTHGYFIPTFPTITPGGAFPAGGALTGSTTDGGTGGGGAHTHSVNLSLSYTDVIIASKD